MRAKLDARPDCVEFRRRAPTGRRSSPVTFCGEALKPIRFGEPPAVAPTDEPDAETNDHEEAIAATTAPGESGAADGCSGVPGRPVTALPTLLFSLAALSLARRRQM